MSVLRSGTWVPMRASRGVAPSSSAAEERSSGRRIPPLPYRLLAPARPGSRYLTDLSSASSSTGRVAAASRLISTSRSPSTTSSSSSAPRTGGLAGNESGYGRHHVSSPRISPAARRASICVGVYPDGPHVIRMSGAGVAPASVLRRGRSVSRPYLLSSYLFVPCSRACFPVSHLRLPLHVFLLLWFQSVSRVHGIQARKRGCNDSSGLRGAKRHGGGMEIWRRHHLAGDSGGRPAGDPRQSSCLLRSSC